MNGLNLPDPKQMDVTVPANLAIGFSAKTTPEIKAATLATADAIDAVKQAGKEGVLLVDLREENERRRDGVIPGSVHLPYQALRDNIKPGGLLAAMAVKPDQEILLYCAFGERSALGLQQMFDAGLTNVRHIEGGIDAWIKAGGPVEKLSKPPAQG